ncbi:hypothetical protein [Mycolicibacterium conceptionense]|uniref:hypothetical protein n=1 Tax=Mycolicibacterium conceptionense TaxID=451644 RepID=UPI000A7F708D|nr:hypothetical protein [Mycolicibacterium conceptionense]
MPMFRIDNLVDKTLSMEFDDVSAEIALENYIAGLDPHEFSKREWESIRDNLLIEQIGD